MFYYSDTYMPMFTGIHFMLGKFWKQPVCPSKNKMWYQYTMKYYSNTNKKFETFIKKMDTAKKN